MKSKREIYTNTLIVTLSFAVIFGTASIIYLTYNHLSLELPPLSNYYLQQYEDTGKSSYLLQSALLNPKRENLINISYYLLDDGEYNTAEIINRLVINNDFWQEAAEAASLNNNLGQSVYYLGQLEDSPHKREIIEFNKILGGNFDDTNLSTSTDAGKLIYMIIKDDYEAFRIEDSIGRDIEIINARYPGRIENNLAQADNLAKAGHTYLALLALKHSSGLCYRDIFLATSGIYQGIGDYNNALISIEGGLSCNSSDSLLLERAVEYATNLDNLSKAEYYKQRLDYLQELDK